MIRFEKKFIKKKKSSLTRFLLFTREKVEAVKTFSCPTFFWLSTHFLYMQQKENDRKCEHKNPYGTPRRALQVFPHFFK